MNWSSFIGRTKIELYKSLGYYAGIDRSARLEASVELMERKLGQIQIARGVHINRRCWLNVPSDDAGVKLAIGERTAIGRANIISAKNFICIGADCLTAPDVLIMDHGHEYRNIRVPIINQGVTQGGEIVIEEGCWIGFGAAIICNRGVLKVGRNSVIGANSVVVSDVEPYSVVAGSPARVIKRYDPKSASWIRESGEIPSRS